MNDMLLAGYKVVISYPQPKMRLAENVPVTDEYRSKINAWLDSFFGKHYILEKGEIIKIEYSNTMIIREDDYYLLQHAVKRIKEQQ